MKAYICNKCGDINMGDSTMKEMVRIDFCTDKIGKYQEAHLCKTCLKDMENLFNGQKENNQ